MESEILLTLRKMQEMIEDSTKVCVCNPKTLKLIEENIEIPPTLYLVSDHNVEEFQMFMLKDKELKKVCMEVYKLQQQEKMVRERMSERDKGEE